MNQRNKNGFTFVEVLTGIVIIGVISTCSWFSVSALFRGEQLTRNRTLATNMLQKSQEELRRASLSFFDTLESCQFPGPSFNASTQNTCGLQVLGPNFNGYTRSVTTTLTSSNSTEIKQAVITVNWTDQGNVLSQTSAVFLARPPMALPGNIIGTVRSSATNDLIPNVAITVSLVTSSTQFLRTSKSSLGASGENFNFNDPSTSAFVLPVGTWRLTATHPAFTYTNPIADIVVTSNTQVRADFMMDPNPQDAKINVSVVNAANSNQKINTLWWGYVNLLEDYTSTNRIVGQSYQNAQVTFTVPFTNNNPRAFTVDTYYAYKSMFAGKTNSQGPPSCLHNYERHGWSSAVHAANDTLTCANPYFGSASTDRIIVSPGQTQNVQVKLHPVPLATITGRVVDQNSNPLKGAIVGGLWPSVDGNNHGCPYFAISNINGEYTLTVPAVQELFPNNNTGALSLYAQRSMPQMTCCNTQNFMMIKSPYILVLNLFENSNVIAPDLVIKSLSPLDCGNVQGNLKDDSTGNSLNGVTVTIQSSNTTTAGSGDYIYQCASQGFRLPAGSSRFLAVKTGYYSYDSGGNMWYNPAPNVNIQPNQMTTYDGKLWPIGKGTVIVNVVDDQSGNPINGAQVKLKTYGGSEATQTTPGNGSVTFNDIMETWPAVGMPSVPFYNTQTTRRHSLDVTGPSGLYSPVTNYPTPILQKGDTITIEIRLTLTGGAI